MGLVWELALKPAEKYVLLAYTDHADHDGNNIRPSKELIAWKTGYTVRQVQNITKKLVKLQLLKPVSTAPGKIIGYKATLNDAPKLSPRKSGKDFTPEKISPLKNETPKDVANFTSTGEIATFTDVLEPSVEPSTEPSIKEHTAPTSAIIIETWLTVQAAVKPKAYKVASNHELARALIAQGINCEDITGYIRWRRADKFWNKFLSLEHVAENILIWKKKHIAVAPPAAPVEPEDASGYIEVDETIWEGMFK